MNDSNIYLISANISGTVVYHRKGSGSKKAMYVCVSVECLYFTDLYTQKVLITTAKR